MFEPSPQLRSKGLVSPSHVISVSDSIPVIVANLKLQSATLYQDTCMGQLWLDQWSIEGKTQIGRDAAVSQIQMDQEGVG